MDFYWIVYFVWGIVSAIVALVVFYMSTEIIKKGWSSHEVSGLWFGLAGILVSLFLLFGLGMVFFHWFAPLPR